MKSDKIARMKHHDQPDTFQQRGLLPLLAWGLVSSAVGLFLALRRHGYWRHYGIQALAWGIIDALLAVNGRRSAAANAARVRAGLRSSADAQRDLRQLRRVLLINAGLDVLYILSGRWTAHRFADRADRRGLGDAITLQGLFLLAYDVLFAETISRRWMTTDD